MNYLAGGPSGVGMPSLSRLGLGTAQFGLDYGVTNRTGRTDNREIRRIVDDALERSLALFDTAPSYGDAETSLGEALAGRQGPRVVTKTPIFDCDAIGPEVEGLIIASAEQSCRRLGRDCVSGLLVHDVRNLLAPGGEWVVEGLHKVRLRGLAEKVGVSIYDGSDFDHILARFKPEIVQIPLSVADRRLVRSGYLARFREMGIEVHVRSVFLQGVLLKNPEALPSYFAEAKPGLRSLADAAAERGLSKAAACLAYALTFSELAAVVVGITGWAEWQDLLESAEAANRVRSYDPQVVEFPEHIVSPNRWPRFRF